MPTDLDFDAALPKVDEQLKHVKPTSFFADMRKSEIEKGRNLSLDAYAIRQQQNWGMLANQIVGAESCKDE